MKIYPNIKIYNGEVENPIFHLTIAKVGKDEGKFLEIKEKLTKILPLKKEVKEITIMHEDENGYWSNHFILRLKEK